MPNRTINLKDIDNLLIELCEEDIRTITGELVYLIKKEYKYRQLKKGINKDSKIIVKDNDYQVISDDEMKKSLEDLDALIHKKGA